MDAALNLIDNWQIEQSAILLSTELPIPFARNVVSKYRVEDYPYKSNYPRPKDKQSEMLTSLFQLLDMIIFSDSILYDSNRSWVWEDHQKTLKPILPLFREIRMGQGTKRKLFEQMKEVISPEVPKIVGESAITYMSMANFLGVDYWPSPQRAAFIQEQCLSRIGTSFANYLKTKIDDELEKIIREIYSEEIENTHIVFPGIGSSILLNCSSKTEILPKIMEYRESKECTAFREWTISMDNALNTGDVFQIAAGIRDLRSVISDIRSKLRMPSKEEKKVELEIGLSPSISFDIAALEPLIRPIKYRKYHLLFIRSHLEKVLHNAKIYRHAYRLFPDLADVF